MSEYFLAASLRRLRYEIDKAFPTRDHASDGWIGDPSHAARASDHNPDWGAPGGRRGVVRAIDTDNDDRNPGRELRQEILSAAIGDPRVYYVISNSVIYSVSYNWAARRYTGSNPHSQHVHVSIRSTHYAETNTSPWFEQRKTLTTVPAVDLSNVAEQFRRAIDDKSVEKLIGVKRVQRALNKRYKADLLVDGKVGDKTVSAWARHEAKVGVDGRPRVPDMDTLRNLGRGRFRVVK